MKKWVWHIGLTAAVSALIAACTFETAGSSLETENSVAVVLSVQQRDGSPAARTRVLVRPSDFLAGANNLSLNHEYSDESPVVETDSSAGVLNMETDEHGRLNLPRLKPGKYTIEVRDDSLKAFTRVAVTDSSLDSVSIRVAAAGGISGQVHMPEGTYSVTVGVQGLDYFVETDTAGNFAFPSIPEGSLNVVGFIYRTYKTVDINGKPAAYSSYLPVGTRTTTVTSSKTSENIIIGQEATVTPPDTTEKPVYPVVKFEDFEDSTYGWYIGVSKYADAKLDAEADLDRGGLVAHFEFSNDSNANWALMGRDLNGMKDLSDLDSLVFWARAGLGDSTQWISLSFDVLLDSIALDSTGYENGKAWVHMELDSVWQRYVVTPKDLIEPDEHNIGGNIGWDNVKKHVTNLNFFGGGVTKGVPYDMWVDDITIYGVKDLE